MTKPLTLLLAALCLVAQPGPESPGPARLPDRVILTWAADPATSLSVTWRTSPAAAAPIVEWTEAGHGPIAPDKVRVWLGHRPSMPDGRPCIGTSRQTPDVIYAFGHGHVGLVGSARTGRLVAQLVSRTEPEIALQPFDPRRFL